MGTVISNLKARFGVDSSDFRKGLKDGEKAVSEFKGAAGNALNEFASMFGLNMSAVNDAIGTAGKSLSFLGSSFKGAASGGNTLAIAMKVLKVALISTGIGALVVALGSVAAYFTRSGEGADKFAKILAQIKSVINNVIERLILFGEALVDIVSFRFAEGWEKMKNAFKGMGEEIKEDWKAAGDLATREDELEDREIDLITTLEARRQKIAELREEAKNLDLTERERLGKLKEAESIARTVYADQVKLERDRLAIMKEKLALQSKDPTDEQRREVAEQEAKISGLLAQQADQIRALTREKNTLLKVVKEELDLEKAKAEQIGVAKASIDNLQFPDFGKTISNVLAPMPKIKESVNNVMLDVTSSVNDAFSSMATGLGEFLGALATGNTGISGFGKMIAGVFADMAINVGKIAIGAGMAVLGIKKALMSLNPVVAIVAGIALVALGTAIKGALSNIASGGTGGGAAAVTASQFTYDTREATAATQRVQVDVSGELVARGPDLVTVINNENNRRNNTT